MAKLPIKTRVIKYAIEKDDIFSAEKVYEEIKNEYPNEKGCSVKAIDNILLVVKGNGYIDYEGAEYNDSGKLVTKYRVTDYGKKCIKYTM